MTFKIAIGGIQHETNTFRTTDVQLTDFAIERGDEILARNAGVRSYVGGMLHEASRLGARVLPTLQATTEPGGIIAADAYSQLVEELLERIRAALPVDVVALALHGAGIARGVENIEIDICEKVRAVVGSSTRIVITLDLHGNLDPRLVELVDVAFCVHNLPHDDMFERGVDAVALAPKLLDGSVTPRGHIEQLPMLLAPVTTMYGTAAAVNALCRETEREAGMLTCTFVHGFPYADTSNTGASVLAFASGGVDQAREAAQRVARFVWESRSEIRAKSYEPEEAIALALKFGQQPVVVLDGADNPGGGCPGDGTFLLKAMFDAKLASACYAAICDPEVVAHAHSSGVGTVIQIALGGKSDSMHGSPIECKAYVKSLTDGRFLRQSPENRGRQVDVGKTARLQIDGVEVVVVSERHQVYEPEIFLIHGIEISRFQIVGVKSTNKWRGGFAGLVAHDFLADTPGLMSQDLRRYSYDHVPRPIWPLDPGVSF